MQTNLKISLNAIRIFIITAKHKSISAAAKELNVTPGAISHQVKNLEETLGISLFIRRNNAIELTAWGSSFYDQLTPGLQIIDRSIDALYRDVNEIRLKVSMSFAVRWLIPALQQFKKRFKNAKVHVETFAQSETSFNHDADFMITYARISDQEHPGIVILKDYSRIVVSPKLLLESQYKTIDDITKIPALTCTAGNWDWLYWQHKIGIKNGHINFVHHFDTDDAAIHGAVAGLGMVLATPLATRNEILTGTLVELPKAPSFLAGYYYLIPGRRQTTVTHQFQDWLITSLKKQP